jgi:allantoate deiminase
MVATVGTIQLRPGAANVIPAEVVFTLDLRAGADPPRLAAFSSFRSEAERIAAARSCSASIETYQEIATTPCVAWIQDALEGAVASLGLRGCRLLSGAGHDGQAMARLTDIGMLFVRCRDGISHHPAEFVSVEDMGLGVAALVRFIEALASRESGTR